MTLWSSSIVVIVMLSSVISLDSVQENCRFNFSYTEGTTGKFTSPGYPNYYPSLLRCSYFFDAAPNGGVHIQFDSFELEDQVDKKDNSCRYDYIDVFTVDNNGFSTWLNRFCGGKLPQEITSPQSKLKILFFTDHWQNSASGFMGTYKFLGDDHQPFEHAEKSCGENRIIGMSGSITSPSFPESYPPNVNCSWIINVPGKKRILVRLEKLDIGSSRPCSDSKLLLYNGYAAPSTISTKDWCGAMSDYDVNELQYVTNSNRTVLRFVSASANKHGSTGFKLRWMAVSIPLQNETCHGFQCKGSRYCHQDGTCDALPNYCISRSLVCDGVNNCGPYDDSDERRCTREILIMAACIAVPSIIFLLIIFLVVYYYRAGHVQKSTSQDQPLAHSQSQNTTSHDSFTSNHHQMIVHTSFVDGACSQPLEATEPDPEPTDIDMETTRGLFSESSNNFRTHKKRPSYHMMQQNYEDGNMIIAQI